uniref:Gag-Pol polyprotein n=1 Tax=Tanacetum cinerariifolium TaxID=118510 RepID=A0A6L2N902_TANCI|nr:hypothetical protein [Tanacetum cinerariifolium]
MSNCSLSTSNCSGKAKTAQPLTTTEEITLCTARKEKRSLNNNSFLGEYEYSSLALERERRDEKKRLDYLKQDLRMDCMMLVKEIVNRLLEEVDNVGLSKTLMMKERRMKKVKVVVKIFVRVKMSRDMLTVGSTMRIPLLNRGEYSQWVEMFMNYLEEQTDWEAMINYIKNGDQPLPRVTQVSIAETSSTEQHILKDKSMWSDQEKKIQKIDRLARSLLIQGLSNDIYSLIDSNKTAKDLWDAFARHMLGSEYVNKIEKLWFYMMINDLKKCGYSKDNCELNFKFLNNLQLEWKQYATMMRQIKNLIDINIDALYNILKQNQGDVNDAMGLKKKIVVVTYDPLALIAEKMKVSKRKEKVVVSLDSEGSDADDFSELKKITALLAKAFNRRKFYYKPTNNNLRTSSTYQSANRK